MSHIDALLALAPAGLTAYDATTPQEPAYPYLLLGAPHFPELHLTLAGDSRPIGGYFTITVVALTAAQARAALAAVHAAYDGAHPAVDGYATWVKHDARASAPLSADREVRLPATGHPIYGVERFRYDATPT